jgi:hypothetical protein
VLLQRSWTREKIWLTPAELAKITAQIGKQIGLAGLDKTAARIDKHIGLARLTGLAKSVARGRKQEVPVGLLTQKAGLWRIRLTWKVRLLKIRLTWKAG